MRKKLHNAAAKPAPEKPVQRGGLFGIFRAIAEERRRERELLSEIVTTLRAAPGGAENYAILKEYGLPLRFSGDLDDTTYAALTLESIKVGFKNGKLQQGLDNEESYIAIQRGLISDTGEDLKLAATMAVALLPHELRHARQTSSSLFFPSAKRVGARDFAWHMRFMEADANAASALFAVKNHAAGNDDYLNAMRATGYKKTAEAALEAYEKDPQSLENGRLKRAAFDAWFEESENIHGAYDLQVMQKWRNYEVTLSALDEDELPKKGLLTARDMEAFGDLDGGDVNYLKLPGFRALDDPFYLRPGDKDAFLQIEEQQKSWEKKNGLLRAAAPRKNGFAASP